MNDNDTIRAIAPIVNSHFRDDLEADVAIELIGQILKWNKTARPEPK